MDKVYGEVGGENILKLNSNDGCCVNDFDNGCTTV